MIKHPLTLNFNLKTLTSNVTRLLFFIPSAAMSSSPSAAVKLVAEYAKSGRSSCKKCSKTIAASALRLGLVSKDPRGFDMTKWHHLNCVPFGVSGSVCSADAITGFSSLKSSDQEAVKKLICEGDQASEKMRGRMINQIKESQRSRSWLCLRKGQSFSWKLPYHLLILKRSIRMLHCCLNGRHLRQSYFLKGMMVFMIQAKLQPLILMVVLQRHP